MDIDKAAKKAAEECEAPIRDAIEGAYQAGLDAACAGIAKAINVLYQKAKAGSPEEEALLEALKIAENWEE